MQKLALLALALFAGAVAAEVYFEEKFDGERGLRGRWAGSDGVLEERLGGCGAGAAAAGRSRPRFFSGACLGRLGGRWRQRQGPAAGCGTVVPCDLCHLAPAAVSQWHACAQLLQRIRSLSETAWQCPSGLAWPQQACTPPTTAVRLLRALAMVNRHHKHPRSVACVRIRTRAQTRRGTSGGSSPAGSRRTGQQGSSSRPPASGTPVKRVSAWVQLRVPRSAAVLPRVCHLLPPRHMHACGHGAWVRCTGSAGCLLACLLVRARAHADCLAVPPPPPRARHRHQTDKGIQTGPDSKYFALYSELKKPVSNEGKDLVLQVCVCACVCVCVCVLSCRCCSRPRHGHGWQAHAALRPSLHRTHPARSSK
jgi:hypothetical protein